MAVGLMMTLLPVKRNLMIQNDCFGRVERLRRIYRKHLFGFTQSTAYNMLACLSYWQWHQLAVGSFFFFFFSGCPVIKLMIMGHWEWAAEGEIYWKIKTLIFWCLESVNKSESVTHAQLLGQFKSWVGKIGGFKATPQKHITLKMHCLIELTSLYLQLRDLCTLWVCHF